MPRPLRATLFAVGGVLLAGLVGSGTLTLLQITSSHDIEASKDFAFNGDTLQIDTDGGAVHLVPGTAGNLHVDRRVTESIRGADPVWSLDGNKLRLDTNCPQFMTFTCDGHYTVTVPLGVPITVRGDDGSISVDNLHQPLDLRSDNGSIRVRDSSGNLKLQSDNGSISVDRTVADRVELSSDNGSLKVSLLNAPMYVKASADNGSARVYVPRGPETYNIRLSTSNGSKDNKLVSDPASPRTIDISTDNGSVKVDYAKPATPKP
jgi:hypothetical protein